MPNIFDEFNDRQNDFLKSWDCKVLLYLNEKECFQVWNGRVLTEISE